MSNKTKFFVCEYDDLSVHQISGEKFLEMIDNFDREQFSFGIEGIKSNSEYACINKLQDLQQMYKDHWVIAMIHQDGERDLYICGDN